MSETTDLAARRAIETVWRMQAPRLVAGLVRILRDISLAEELAQDALVIALDQWPKTGVPDNPAAWLMTTAKRRAIDYFRRNAMAARKLETLAHEIETDAAPPDPADRLDDDLGDELLGLMFISCHPALSSEAQAALTLRLIGGLSTGEIARAFLVSEATMAQRIVRAKKTIAEAGIGYEIPIGADRRARLGAVLGVLYLIFNEGYSATAGQDWMRPQLCEEAVRLARILVGLAPDEPEVHGLVALLELQSSRLRARTGLDGQPVLLLAQNRGNWDRLLIGRGLAALDTAEALGGGNGYYALQAGIAACHARAATPEATDWSRIARLYGALAVIAPSPIIELNRAVAIGMADGAAAGLAHLEAAVDASALKAYPLFEAARGDLLEKLGRFVEAAEAFERAAKLTQNASERAVLEQRGRNITKNLTGS